MNPNHSCGIDAFLIKSCPDVVKAFYLVIKIDLSACQTALT
jgi:predicted nucleotide-binding protein (sugar kinase/HSP70/actin superfamily)